MVNLEILTLKEIASLLVEFEKLRKSNPDTSSEAFRRLTRVGDVLGEITLRGDQIADLREYGFSLITEEDIRISSSYTELQREYDKLEQKYERLEARYNALVRQAESDFRTQFRLKDLIDKQQKEILEERE